MLLREMIRYSTGEVPMKYLHTMIRVANLDASLDFFVNKLGFACCHNSE